MWGRSTGRRVRFGDAAEKRSLCCVCTSQVSVLRVYLTCVPARGLFPVLDTALFRTPTGSSGFFRNSEVPESMPERCAGPARPRAGTQGGVDPASYCEPFLCLLALLQRLPMSRLRTSPHFSFKGPGISENMRQLMRNS